VNRLCSWYDVAVQRRGRTPVDTTGMSPEAVAAFIAAFARGEESHNPLPEIVPSMTLKMAGEDLKAYYKPKGKA